LNKKFGGKKMVTSIAAERLIVAADYDPREEGGVPGVSRKVLTLGNDLKGAGVYIKINSILRACGYGLISELHSKGLKVFADLKLTDISNTLDLDAAMLLEYKPELVTVMCSSGGKAVKKVVDVLGASTEVLGVTVLTDLDDAMCKKIHGDTVLNTVKKLGIIARDAGLRNLVCSAIESRSITSDPEFESLKTNCPAIRPEWSLVAADDQERSRVVTISQAFAYGAYRIVVGRPITQKKDPMAALKRTIEEINEAIEL
jgi:orotidine-5'-phosphate decarboxylase